MTLTQDSASLQSRGLAPKRVVHAGCTSYLQLSSGACQCFQKRIHSSGSDLDLNDLTVGRNRLCATRQSGNKSSLCNITLNTILSLMCHN